MAYGYKRTLAIDHTQCGSADSSSFPLLVNITDATLKTTANGGHVQNSSGYDIGFFSDSSLSSALFWEIDAYDGTAGTIIAWVKVPTVSVSVDTVIYMGYGDSGISTFQSTASSVWDANFKTVYHLGNGSSISLADSTSNGNTASNSGATAVTGQLSGGVSMNGSSSYMNGSVSIINIPTSTMSVWVSVQSAPSKDSMVIGLRDGVGSSTCDHVVVVDSSLQAKFYLYDGLLKYTTVSSPLSLNTWTLLTGVNDGTNAFIYVNGVQAGTIAASTAYTAYTVPNFVVGGQDNGSLFTYLTASMDETRVSSGARSSSWILTEYNNQKPDSTMVGVGSESAISQNTISVISHLFGFFDMGDFRI